MRKLMLIALSLFLTSPALAEKETLQKTPQKQVRRKQKQKQKEEVVVKLAPLKPPESLIKNSDDEEFEKQLEALRRQFKLLELKAKIMKLKAEMDKLQNPLPAVKLQQSPQQLQVESIKSIKLHRGEEVRNKELSLKERMIQYQLKQREQQLLQAKLSYLQNLFTGIVDINGQRVAFDSVGRKYTKGVAVEGMQIVDILPDGVVVADPNTKSLYKVPIGSGLASTGEMKGGKRKGNRSLTSSQAFGNLNVE